MRPLAVIGNVNVDLIMGPVTPWPMPGTEIMTPYSDLRVGGAAGNTALAWAGLGVAHQIAASIGNDHFGRYLSEGFATYTARWRIEPVATSLSVGLTHPNGERTFFTTDGHLKAYDADAALSGLDWESLSGGVLLVCGTFITGHYGDYYAALLDKAAAHQIDIALDTGWPVDGWTDAHRQAIAALLPRVQHVLFNEIEALSLTGTDSVEAAAAALTALAPSAVVVIKRGPDGASAWTTGETSHAVVPAVDVLDTIGAGDVFNAGYLAAIAQGLPLGQALTFANRIAASAISTSPRRYNALL